MLNALTIITYFLFSYFSNLQIMSREMYTTLLSAQFATFFCIVWLQAEYEVTRKKLVNPPTVAWKIET